jgi:phosphatidylinositol-3-phosphatase
MKRKIVVTLFLFGLLISACQPVKQKPTPSPIPKGTATPIFTPTTTVTPTLIPFATAAPTATPARQVPQFKHVVIIVLENHEYDVVIGNPQMPNFNHWAEQYSLLTHDFAIRHPSLPNYLALIGGDTFGIQSDCEECFVNSQSLPDLIEASGRTWKGYMETMPKPCFIGSTMKYAQKHNPFIYFDPIRLNTTRCTNSVVPLDQLDQDLADNNLPDFLFISPNICNDAHDCDLPIADGWLGIWVNKLLAVPGFVDNSLIVLTWDEGQGEHAWNGFSGGGGRVATVLISGYARPGYKDNTLYTHYSLLKTILASWDLPALNHTADADTALIVSPWILK